MGFSGGQSGISGANDVALSNAGNDHLLTYDSTVGKWTNRTPTQTKTSIGLGNVDNTSDASKPISSAVQTALDAKAATVHTHTASQISDSTATGRSLVTAADALAARSAIGAGTSNLTLGTSSTTAKAGDYAPTKADVGLGNVDNTSDANKPVSTAQATALSAKADNTTVVHLIGNETIAGTKTFSSSPIVPTPTAPEHATTKAYVDSLSGGQASNYQRAEKLSNTSRASTTTATVDPDLVLPVQANSKYVYDLMIMYDADPAVDIKLQINAPTGSTIFGLGYGVASAATGPLVPESPMTIHSVRSTNTAFGAAGGVGVGTNVGYHLTGTLTTSATAGNFSLSWAQNTSSVTATTIISRSELSTAKVA